MHSGMPDDEALRVMAPDAYQTMWKDVPDERSCEERGCEVT
jgi:hypothetical protein